MMLEFEKALLATKSRWRVLEVRSEPLGLVNGVLESITGVVSKHLKKNGVFKLASMVIMQ